MPTWRLAQKSPALVYESNYDHDDFFVEMKFKLDMLCTLNVHDGKKYRSSIV